MWSGINVYRFVESYALIEAPLDTPIYFFRDFKRWENYAYVVCSSLLIWIADVLVVSIAIQIKRSATTCLQGL